MEKSEKFSKTLHEEKKSRLRAFARTRAKNGQYCCSEPIQKEFDQCDGVEEKCHYNSGCDNCKFFFVGGTKFLHLILHTILVF